MARELAITAEREQQGACLLERMQRPRLTCEGELPDGTAIVWRLLTASEKQIAKGKARARLLLVGLDPDAWSQEDELAREVAWQMLAIAMRDPGVKGTARNPYPTPAAWIEDEKSKERIADADTLRGLLTVPECQVMLEQYLAFEDAQSPDLDRLSDEDTAALENAIKKKDSETLRCFGVAMLATYLITTENHPSTSLTDKSSSGPGSGAPNQ